MLANKVLAATIAILLLSSVALVSVPIQSRAQEDNGNGNGDGNGDNGEQAPLTVSVSAGTTDIVRGNTQTLHIVTSEPEAFVYGYIQYASGAIPRTIIGQTDAAGKLDYQWRVGAGSQPGQFTAVVLAIAGNNIEDIATGSSQFNVRTATAQPVPTPTPEPTPVPSENVTTTNDTTVIDPEQNATDIIVAPVNETTVVTEENGTDVSIPINETSVVIPTNETIEPEPSTNETEVIVVPEEETEIVTEENVTDSEIIIPEEVIEDINATVDPVVIAPANESDVAVNNTAEEETPGPEVEAQVCPPICGEVVIAPVNETTVVTPENGTEISVPINETSVVIPSNETLEPEASANETEVIIAPEDTSEVVTPDNVTDSTVPEENVSVVNETVVVVPSDEVVIAVNETTEAQQNGTIVCIQAPCPGGETVDPAEGNLTTDPEPDAQPGNVTVGNGTDIIVEPPLIITPENETTQVPGPIEEVIQNVTDEVDQAVEDVEQGDPQAQETLNVAMVNAINALVNLLEETVPGLTEEDVQGLPLEDLNSALEKALAVVPQS